MPWGIFAGIEFGSGMVTGRWRPFWIAAIRQPSGVRTQTMRPLFEPFAARLADLYATYSDAEFAVILGFLHRSAELQREATRALTEQG